MSFAQALSAYLNLNILIAVAVTALFAISILQRWLKNSLSASVELKLHYNMVLLILFLVIAPAFLPKSDFFKPPVKIWAAPSTKGFNQFYSQTANSGFINVHLEQKHSIAADRFSNLGKLLCALTLLVGAILLARDLRSLLLIKKSSYLLRRLKTVHIFFNDEIRVPFSFWLPLQFNIVLPTKILRSPDYKMALAHEIQHHRQGDTKWVYAFWLLKLICPLNPFVYIWNRMISEIQEFACDATLVDRKKVTSLAYARCLVEVAQSAIVETRNPVCATGLRFLVDGTILKRRIQKMFNNNKKLNGSVAGAIGLFFVGTMALTSYAASGLVQDRRITMTQAELMLKKAKAKSDFPVVVNQKVLKWLNHYVGTPEGREFIRQSLQRLENHRQLVEGKLDLYGVPKEILALPIVESGYQNLEASQNPLRAAGVWQFIASTAKKYGLRVDDQVDDRLNLERSTDAALRYLKSNKLQFNSWPLGVLAYNCGEERVYEAIEEHGTKSAWELIKTEALPQETREYYPKFMAAILILQNPETVE